MAKLTRDDVLKLAKLSRLHLSDDEVDQFLAEIQSILKYVEQLEAVDTEGVEPTYQVTGLTNVTRKDEVLDIATPKELLKNTPKLRDDEIEVKRMIV